MLNDNSYDFDALRKVVQLVDKWREQVYKLLV